jgi:hypothetical protein
MQILFRCSETVLTGAINLILPIYIFTLLKIDCGILRTINMVGAQTAETYVEIALGHSVDVIALPSAPINPLAREPTCFAVYVRGQMCC